MSTRETAQDIAPQLNKIDFYSPFVLGADGSVLATDDYVPAVHHDPDSDIVIEGDGWDAMTGLTGQHGYRGAVMHQSEFIGQGVAEVMLDLCADGPVTFAVVPVDVMPTDDEPEPEPAGWAIIHRS